MRWVLAVVAVATCLVSSEPTGAQTYPGCVVEASDIRVEAGDTITISGTNAQPEEQVVASLDERVIGRGTADGAGDFSFPATIPADIIAGRHLVEVRCGPSGATLALTLTVGPVAPTGGRLPKTGSGATIPLTRIAVGLIAVGGLVALTMSRRRAAAA
ncbi:MAG: LPXTG cell wall anchor domain-containing protein [Acidimicrobiales bacterium]